MREANEQESPTLLIYDRMSIIIAHCSITAPLLLFIYFFYCALSANQVDVCSLWCVRGETINFIKNQNKLLWAAESTSCYDATNSLPRSGEHWAAAHLKTMALIGVRKKKNRSLTGWKRVGRVWNFPATCFGAKLRECIRSIDASSLIKWDSFFCS